MIVMTWNSISLLASHLETIIGYKTAAHAGAAPFPATADWKTIETSGSVCGSDPASPRATLFIQAFTCQTSKKDRTCSFSAYDFICSSGCKSTVTTSVLGLCPKQQSGWVLPLRRLPDSFRVKFSQTLDFLLQTSHSNTLASPPRFFPSK